MHKKMIPLKKQSKKAQRKFYQSRRGTWNGLNPVTRVPPNSKTYDRSKAKRAAKGTAE